MPEKDPLTYAAATYSWVFLISILGGLSGYIRKLKNGKNERFKIAELIGEIVISAFVGVITFFLCESAHVNPVLSAALIGIASHMGSRAIYIMEEIALKKIKTLVEK
jgi:hypothetical protein